MKNYKEYKAIKKDYKRREQECLDALVQEINEQTSITAFINNWWLKELLTNSSITRINNNNITIEEVKEKAKAKAIKDFEKKLAIFGEKCDKIAQAEDIDTITIKIEWIRSRTWGFNPHAEVYANGYTTGSASGCGYDKRSAAVAEAFNKNLSILKLLYNAQEKNLRSSEPLSMRDALGYGSGYIVPRFDGGVGYSSFENIFRKLGFTTLWEEGKTWDYMRIEKRKKGAK